MLSLGPKTHHLSVVRDISLGQNPMVNQLQHKGYNSPTSHWHSRSVVILVTLCIMNGVCALGVALGWEVHGLSVNNAHCVCGVAACRLYLFAVAFFNGNRTEEASRVLPIGME